MKLTGELKKKVDAAENRTEKRDIIAKAGMELTEEELESVSGGRNLGVHSEYKSHEIV